MITVIQGLRGSGKTSTLKHFLERQLSKGEMAYSNLIYFSESNNYMPFGSAGEINKITSNWIGPSQVLIIDEFENRFKESSGWTVNITQILQWINNTGSDVYLSCSSTEILPLELRKKIDILLTSTYQKDCITLTYNFNPKFGD